MDSTIFPEKHAHFRNKDYYQILGLSYDCTFEEIVGAFRKMVKIFHPDKSGIQEYSIFGMIVEAYKTLSRKEERDLYDAKLGVKLTRKEDKGRFPTVLLDKLRVEFAFQMTDLLRNGLLRKRQLRGTLRKKTRKEYDYSIAITPKEQSCRIILPLDLPVKKRCPQCLGDLIMTSICPVCNGTGQVTEMKSTHIMLPPYIPSGSILKVELSKVNPGGLAYFRSKTVKVRVLVTI